MKEEKDFAHHEYHRKFKEMMRKAREEKRQSDEIKAKAEAEAKGENWEAPMPTDPENKENQPGFQVSKDVSDEKMPKVYEVVEDKDDLPPALEQVDIEAEREKKMNEAAAPTEVVKAVEEVAESEA